MTDTNRERRKGHSQDEKNERMRKKRAKNENNR